MDNEQWRDVVGFESLYSVSSLGRVRSAGRIVPGKHGSLRRLPVTMLKGWKTQEGYVACRLYRSDGTSTTANIHRLVAIAFLGTPPPRHEVNHVDGHKANNRLENIEYVTHSNNIRHAFSTGLSKQGAAHHRAKLTAAQVTEIRAANISPRGSAAALAARFNVAIVTIRKVHRCVTWVHQR